MNLANRDMSYLEKYQTINPSKYLSKGIKKPRFRKAKKQIRNRVLYAILLSKNIKISELANSLGISSRAIQAWIVDGIIPNQTNMDKVCSELHYPSHILFNEVTINRSPIICIPKGSKYYKRVVSVSIARNRVLHGLMVIYDISVKDLAGFLNLSEGTIRKYIHEKFLPDPQIQKDISDFFKVSSSELFFDALSS